MRIRCRAGSKFLGEGGFRTGPPSCRHGVVARAGVLPQLATAAHPCAARPPWRQDGVLPARRGRGFDRCPGLASIEHSAEILERRQRGAAPAVTPSIEATTPKMAEDAVSWGEGPSGTWMCHDPSKDRMSSRGMGPLPRARRPLPKPTLSFGVCEAEAVTAHPKPTLPPPSPKPTLRAEPRAATPQARKEKARERSRASICFGAWRPSPQPPGIGTGIASAGTVGYGSSSSR